MQYPTFKGDRVTVKKISSELAEEKCKIRKEEMRNIIVAFYNVWHKSASKSTWDTHGGQGSSEQLLDFGMNLKYIFVIEDFVMCQFGS